jgi:hypothetical protein
MIVPAEPTVRDLVNAFDSLGVPHFQRGDIWNHENVAQLLVSLLFDTPCGTIILWEPKDPAIEGVSLSGKGVPELLVVDGQQRLRALHAAFGPTPGCENDQFQDQDDGGMPRSGEKEPAHLWCLNLASMTEFEELIADGDNTQFGLFCQVVDPRKPSKARRYNLIPLEMLTSEDGGIGNLLRASGGRTEALRTAVEGAGLPDRIRAVLDKRLFFARTLVETDGRNRLADVVALYNRINSSGKRVEAEERAFASLVSLSPEAGSWVKRVFHSLYPPPTKGELQRRDAERRLRDEILQRRKEHQFGFKFFIRVLVQVSTYYLNSSLGTGSFSFDVVSSRPFQRRVKESPASLTTLFDRTQAVIVEVRALLRALGCDDLQMLPDTSSLLPLFQLLISFPSLGSELAADGVTVLQGLALRMLLSDPRRQDDPLRLVKDVNAAPDAREALTILDRKLPSAQKLQSELNSRLLEANALQDRHTLLLYWLLRHKGAKDFSYKNLAELVQRRLKPGSEAILDESCEPERQHVVPYRFLEEIYQIEKRGRVSRHIANNIGNITWISAASNGFDGGLSDRFVDLSLEDPADNADRHLLGEGNAARLYRATQNAIQRYMAKPTDQSCRRAVLAFEAMCRCRARLIARAFSSWVGEQSPVSSFRKRLEPEPRFIPSLADLVRECGYPDEFESELIKFVQAKGIRLAEVSNGGRLTRRLRTSADRVGLVISFSPGGLEVKGKPGVGLFGRLVKWSSAFATPVSQGSRATLLLPPTSDSTQVVRRFRNVISRRRAREKKA